MILLIFLLLGLLIGMLRGGGLSGLAGLKLRGVWLVFVSAAAEILILLLPSFFSGLFPAILVYLQIARFIPLFLFAIVNMKKWQVCLIGLGFAMNFTVIMLNGWQMPVSWDAMPKQVPDVEYVVMRGYGDANLWVLADIIPVLPYRKSYASIGDIVLGLGVLLTVQHGMARYSAGKHARGSLARKPQDTVRRADDRRTPGPDKADKPKVQELAQEISQPIAAASPAEEQMPQPGSPAEPDPIGFLPLTGPFPHPEPGPADMPGGQSASETHSIEDGMKIPIRLSPRLETIARMIDRRATVADVGCDHGKLSAYLALNGSPRVIALDVSPKSLAKTKLLVKELSLHKIVQARVGDGLRKVRPGEADIIVIAGLGGPSMCSILQDGQAVASSAMKLVLQPMNAVGTVRRWLADNGFCIVDEQLAEEDGRIYQILAAVPGSDGHPPMSLFDLEVGHLLIDNRHPLLPRLLQYKTAAIDNILAEIAGNVTPKAEARRSELIELRGRCAEVFEWLAR